MKVRVFKKRDRTTPDRATGWLVCNVTLPSLGRREFETAGPRANHGRTFAAIRRFVLSHLPLDDESREGARFVIDVQVRAAGGGLRRKRLVTWRSGESVRDAIAKASAAWKKIEKEETDSASVEVDL